MDDDKVNAVLDAGFEVFIRYGYRRTTMADLADAAGVARPTLYTRFKNKRDLFRAVVERQVACALDRAAAALGADGPLLDRLLEAYLRWTGDFLAVFNASPHAREVMDSSESEAGDVIHAAAASFDAAATRAIAAAARAGEVDLGRPGLSPPQVARLLTDASTGAKVDLVDPATYRRRMVAALALVDAATRKPRRRPWRPPGS